MLAPIEDLGDALGVPRRERLLLVALQELREAEDRVERRAELVAHRREEIDFRRVRDLCLVARHIGFAEETRVVDRQRMRGVDRVE